MYWYDLYINWTTNYQKDPNSGQAFVTVFQSRDFRRVEIFRCVPAALLLIASFVPKITREHHRIPKFFPHWHQVYHILTFLAMLMLVALHPTPVSLSVGHTKFQTSVALYEAWELVSSTFEEKAGNFVIGRNGVWESPANFCQRQLLAETKCVSKCVSLIFIKNLTQITHGGAQLYQITTFQLLFCSNDTILKTLVAEVGQISIAIHSSRCESFSNFVSTS